MNLGTVFGDARLLLRRNLWRLALGLLVAWGFAFAIPFYGLWKISNSYLGFVDSQTTVVGLVIVALSEIIAIAVVGGLFGSLIAALREDRPVRLSLHCGLLQIVRLVPAVAGGLVLAVLGFWWFVVPGLLVLTILPYTVPLIVDERRNPLSALYRSARLVLRHDPVRHFLLAFIVCCAVAALWLVLLWIASTRGLSFPSFSDYGMYTPVAVGAVAAWVIVLIAAIGLLVPGLFVVPLICVLYVQAQQAAPDQGGSSTASSARRPWRQTVAVAAVAILVVSAFLGLDWLNRGVASHRSLKAGERITLGNGVSFAVPAGRTGYYARFYRYPAWLKMGQNAWEGASERFWLGGNGDIFEVTRFYDSHSSWLRKAGQGPVVCTSRDGAVQVRKYGPYSLLYVIHTRDQLPTVVLVLLDKNMKTTAEAAQWARALWKAVSPEGAPAPTITT